MTQNDKELLLTDLCSRLPYGVMAQVYGWDDEEEIDVTVPVRVYSINTDGYVYFGVNDYNVDYYTIEDCTPYLRPMTSMTEEEKKEFYTFQYKFTLQTHEYQELNKETFSEYSDWLNKKMFDYRDLIPKGLALEAPEGMYKVGEE